MRNTRFQACLAGRTGTNPPPVALQNGRIVARALLSDVQYAYLLSELGGYSLGGPALFYEEYTCERFDLIAFSRALHQLMSRHEMLRATFDASGTLRVHSDLPVPLSYHSLRGLSEDVCRERLAASRDECFSRATPLVDAAPFAVRVFTLDRQTIVQVLGRLLAMDPISSEIFSRELRALLAGQQLPPLSYTFRDYRDDAERRKELPEYIAARAYWLDRLDVLPAPPELPQVRDMRNPDPLLIRRVFTMPADLSTALTLAAKRNGLTPTMAVGTAFCELLRHWARIPRFTINVMDDERQSAHPDVSKVIGSFSSVMLLECAPGPQDRTFLDRARTWRSQLVRDLRHAAFSGLSVTRELNQRNGGSGDALLPIVFMSTLGGDDHSTGDFLEQPGWQRLGRSVRTPQVALEHHLSMVDGRLVVQWDTADDIFVPGLIDDMFAAYEALLTQLATSEDAWHAESFDLTPAVQSEIRDRTNDTDAAAAPLTLNELFEQQVERCPEAAAVITPTVQVTYAQLHRRASAIATALLARSIGSGDLVGVMAPRGPDQVAAAFGVMMAGAAYVPISPQWPDADRQQVARICGLRLLLVGDGVVTPKVPVEVETLELATAISAHARAPAVASTRDSESLAYVIFSSDDNGISKGVMVKHAAASNTVIDINERFAIGPSDRVLAVSPDVSDLSVWDVFGMLAAGGAVVMPDPAAAIEVTHLHELALCHDVTIWNSVPAYLAMFVEFVRSGGRSRLPALRLALVRGDWVPLTLGRDLQDAAPNAVCVRLGGATEASIWSNLYQVPTTPPADWVSVPYGFPMRNQRLHVLDAGLRDRPDWVPGEIHIAGRGLAEGYLDSPQLTASAFIPYPRTGETVYRTGDWGRYWPDGTLEFLGHKDQPVKVNGHHVKLAEIEAALVAHPAVSDAVVVTRRGGHGVCVVGFAASENDPATLRVELLSHLAQLLPGHMVPRVIEVRPSLPLTANGKVDRRLLAQQALAANTTTLTAAMTPAGATERALARIWEELLEVPQMGRADDFFAYGGNSLHAAQLMNRIEFEFGQRLPTAALYATMTIEKLALQLGVRAPVWPRRSLVRMGGATSGTPLVLVHPVNGDLLCYRHLVSAVESRSIVYGLSQVPRPMGTTIEEMAAHYLTELLAVTEDRPVRVAGWSSGGVIAYEMGRQLLRERRECTVVMIDPLVRRRGEMPPSNATLLHSFLCHLTESEVDLGEIALDPQEPALQALYRIWGNTPDELAVLKSMTFDELSATYRFFARNTDALLRYGFTAEPDLPVQIIDAADGLCGPTAAYLSPLREVMPGFAATLSLPGNHFTLLQLETAPRVARLL